MNTVPLATQNGTEDTDLLFSAATGNAISVSDVDAPTLTVTLSVGHGSLTLAGTGGLSFQSGANGGSQMTITGTASAINAALDGLVYRGGLNYNGSDSLTITTTDGGATGSGGTRTDSDSIAITLVADNVIDGDGGDNGGIVGTPQADLFDLSQGGADSVSGLDGGDGFYFGAEYTVADVVDGGGGNLDQIGLQGDYGAGVTLGSLVGVEFAVLMSGGDTRFGEPGTNFYDYSIIANGSTVVTGNRLTIQANTLRVGEDFTFDGSATAIEFLIYGGLGDDSLTGGSGNDGFFFGDGRFGTNDVVNGGAGNMDQLGLQGNFTSTGAGPVVFGASQLSGIEFIVLLSADDNRFGANGGLARYDLTMNDANNASTGRMIVSANTLRTGETLTFNGAQETSGSFQIFSGAADDRLTGSQSADDVWGGGGADTISGQDGADTLRGGLGDDTFLYGAASHSTDAARDQILDFSAGDTIDLRMLASSNGLAGFNFIGSAERSGPGQLQVLQNGDQATVRVFIDNDGVADLVIDVTAVGGRQLVATDFAGVTGSSSSRSAGMESGRDMWLLVGSGAPSELDFRGLQSHSGDAGPMLADLDCARGDAAFGTTGLSDPHGLDETLMSLSDYGAIEVLIHGVHSDLII